jgi:hypothetical protein
MTELYAVPDKRLTEADPRLPSPSQAWRIIHDMYGRGIADRLFPEGMPPRDAA